ncbi:MAG: GNAT family N-acetyltransferase, partial [Candidatus Lokiarchaeota archaeon]|nr:GNAT family N-acetyltransferase [Candidatus Lokiarchaeota archaeon]
MPGGLAIEPFSEGNVEELHAFFEAQAGAGLYSFPLETFKRATVADADFDPEYSIVARDEASKEIVAAFFAVARSARLSLLGKVVTVSSAVLTMFAVREGRRRKGIGTALLSTLLARLKAG